MKFRNKIFSFLLVVTSLTLPNVSSAQQNAEPHAGTPLTPCPVPLVSDGKGGCAPLKKFTPPGPYKTAEDGEFLSVLSDPLNPHELDMALAKVARAYAKASGTDMSRVKAAASIRNELMTTFSPIERASFAQQVNKISSAELQRFAAIDLLSRTKGGNQGTVGPFARIMIDSGIAGMSLDMSASMKNMKVSTRITPEDKEIAAKIGTAICSGSCPAPKQRTIESAVRWDRLNHGGLQANVGPMSAEDLAVKTSADPALASYRRNLAAGTVGEGSVDNAGPGSQPSTDTLVAVPGNSPQASTGASTINTIAPPSAGQRDIDTTIPQSSSPPPNRSKPN